jgi:hypothetical protein
MFAWTTFNARTLAALLRALLEQKATPEKAERR